MNLTQADDKVIKLLNYHSVSGNIIPNSDPNGSDYRLRFRVLYDACQKEIATTAKKIRKSYRFSQNPIPSQLPNPLYNFDIRQHLASDITYSASGSKAYTFKVDNIATIYIEEETSPNVWSTLATILHTTPTGQYTEYKGFITAGNPSNNVRLRFGGQYVYNIRDIALFAYSFPNTGAIPQYQRYNLYTMPTDFYKLNKVIFKGNPTEGYPYSPTSDFFWESRNVIAINYYNKGEYTIDYFAYPTTIDDNTSSNYVFEVDPEAAEAIPYYVAAHMMMDENGNINNKLYAMYQSKLANMDDTISNGSTSISNTLFDSSMSNNKLF